MLGGGHMMNGHGVGGGFAFGRLVVPPPPPVSRNQHIPKPVIEIKEKLLVSDPNAWKPNMLKKRGPAASAEKEEEQKSEEELLITVRKMNNWR
jgi:hypothetical protein